MKTLFKSLLGACFLFSSAFADNCCFLEELPASCCDEYIPNVHPHRFYIGPEIYYLRRTRDGGTKQRGAIYGLRVGYERVQRCKFYCGLDYLFGEGELHGKSNVGKLKSTYRDENIEGRLGYTLQTKDDYHLSLTPFVGYGYFRETNRFHHDHPMRVKFQTRFHYCALGFLSNMAVSPQWNIGVNFKARLTFDSRCRISDDPGIKNMTQLISDKPHYRVELPISYRLCRCIERFELDFVPFFEYRHFGSKNNYPFDYLNTKFQIYGINLQFSYRL